MDSLKKQMICRGKEMRADKIVLWGNAGDQPRDNAHTWDNSHGIEKDSERGIEKEG